LKSGLNNVWGQVESARAARTRPRPEKPVEACRGPDVGSPGDVDE
jgi:hypothetical protein